MKCLYGVLLICLLAGCSSAAKPTAQTAENNLNRRSVSCTKSYEIPACDAAVAASRDDPAALTLALADRSAAYSKTSKNDLAEADCREMLLLGADLDTASTACGYVALLAGHYDEALSHFDRAGPEAGDPGARAFGRAMTYYAMGETRLAAENFDRAAHSEPRRPDYQLWRYLALAELGTPDKTELVQHNEAYDWDISSTSNPMIDFQLGETDEQYAWDHLYLFHDSRGLDRATLQCFFQFNLAHKAMVAGDLQGAAKHRDAGAAVCTPGEQSFHAFKGLSKTLNARFPET